MRYGHLAKVAITLAGLALLAGCDDGPEGQSGDGQASERSPLDVSAYRGDKVCDLLPKEKLSAAGFTDPGEPLTFMGGIDGCEWREDGILALSLVDESLESADVASDSKYRSSESGTLGGYPSVTAWFPNTETCNVYVEAGPKAYLELQVRDFGTGEKQCDLGEDLLGAAVEQLKAG
ncbi:MULTISPECIES: DUF3558 family protein [Thermocrispum]|uniref:DUF3558 domain-containing protein n=1 Tax=Thermocrispum agreste TaxID=37925 RepID=A0A2W4JQI0_9PSEU|nr:MULTISPECIES: DUF3558 family protein [Thermocrispum]PZN01313.1 MAG: DUF3558 domain-containing protein [Thermocrispum agreste]